MDIFSGYVARWPLDETRFHMLLSPFVYMTIDGRRHIRNIRFNASQEKLDREDFLNLELDSPEVLEIEKTFAKRHVTVRF